MSSHRYILGMRVDTTSYEDATDKIVGWARVGETRYVCVANVHMTMEAYDKSGFRCVVNHADLVTPDGMPLVWALRLLGVRGQQRVYGPTLTLFVCEKAARDKVPIALYGGTPESLKAFSESLTSRYPDLVIAEQISPPFRGLSPEEDLAFTNRLVKSGAKIVLVGIGCPKQEQWMAEHRDRIPAVLVGVGAAFDFHSGRVKQAPTWMQLIGLEWLFRLLMEPGRLWKRYLKHNPRFIVLLVLQLLGVRRFSEV